MSQLESLKKLNIAQPDKKENYFALDYAFVVSYEGEFSDQLSTEMSMGFK